MPGKLPSSRRSWEKTSTPSAPPSVSLLRQSTTRGIIFYGIHYACAFVLLTVLYRYKLNICECLRAVVSLDPTQDPKLTTAGDVGGQKTLRSYWRNYFEKTDALIWVVDATDRLRIDDCRAELHGLLEEEVCHVPAIFESGCRADCGHYDATEACRSQPVGVCQQDRRGGLYVGARDARGRPILASSWHCRGIAEALQKHCRSGSLTTQPRLFGSRRSGRIDGISSGAVR